MRVSVVPGDTGFDPRIITGGRDGGRVRVWVNGLEQKLCVTADEELGFALCLAANDEGQPFIDPENPKAAKTELKHGQVVVLLPPDWADGMNRHARRRLDAMRRSARRKIKKHQEARQ